MHHCIFFKILIHGVTYLDAFILVFKRVLFFTHFVNLFLYSQFNNSWLRNITFFTFKLIHLSCSLQKYLYKGQAVGTEIQQRNVSISCSQAYFVVPFECRGTPPTLQLSWKQWRHTRPLVRIEIKTQPTRCSDAGSQEREREEHASLPAATGKRSGGSGL